MKELREGTPPETKDASPEEVLRENGLERSGGSFLLGGEADSERQLVVIRATFQEHRTIVLRLAEIYQNDARIDELYRLRVWADDQVRAHRIELDSIPSRGNNLIVDYYQAVQRSWNGFRTQVREIDLEIGVRKGNRPGGADRQELNRNRERLENSFREDVYGLRRVVDATDVKYRELAQAGVVEDALRGMGKKIPNVKLGPSDRFGVIRRELAKAEVELNGRK